MNTEKNKDLSPKKININSGGSDVKNKNEENVDQTKNPNYTENKNSQNKESTDRRKMSSSVQSSTDQPEEVTGANDPFTQQTI